MKQFEVDVDITMSKRLRVEAESEEHAKAIVNGWMKYNPYEYAHDFDAYVEHEITDVNEEDDDEEKTDIQKAIDYVRDNMDSDEMAILKAEMNQCYKSHLTPAENVMDCSKVVELLDEYGQENDLPERWWESECEIDEILCEL